MYRTTLVMLLALFALPAESFAQPPMYEPYGAWRGRIRYHEGPLGGVRTRIRWSNGLTPVGGQVLMHLGTVAGNVFTNPNVLGALAGVPGAPRNAEVDPELIAAIERIGQNNDAMLAELNQVRASVGLAPAAFPAAAVAPQPGAATGGSAAVAALGEEWVSLRDAIGQRRQDILLDALAAIEAGNAAGATLSPQQAERLTLLKDRVVRSAVLSEGIPQLDAPATTPDQFDDRAKNVSDGWRLLGELLGKAVDVGTRLLAADPSANEENRLSGQIEAFRRYHAEVQAINL
jgi:hypothetical protein